MSNVLKLSEIHTLFGRKPGMAELLAWCSEHLEAAHSGIAFYGVLQPAAVFDDATRDLIREASETPFETLMPGRQETIPTRHGEAHWLPYIAQTVFHTAKLDGCTLDQAFEALEGIEVASITFVPSRAVGGTLCYADLDKAFGPNVAPDKALLSRIAATCADDELENPIPQNLREYFDGGAYVFGASGAAPLGAQTALAMRGFAKQVALGAVLLEQQGATIMTTDEYGNVQAVVVPPHALSDLASTLDEWTKAHFDAAMANMGVE